MKTKTQKVAKKTPTGSRRTKPRRICKPYAPQGVIGYNGLSFDAALKDVAQYLRDPEADPSHVKRMLDVALERHSGLRLVIEWTPLGPERDHLIRIVDAQRGVASGLARLLWPLKKEK